MSATLLGYSVDQRPGSGLRASGPPTPRAPPGLMATLLTANTGTVPTVQNLFGRAGRRDGLDPSSSEAPQQSPRQEPAPSRSYSSGQEEAVFPGQGGSNPVPCPRAGASGCPKAPQEGGHSTLSEGTLPWGPSAVHPWPCPICPPLGSAHMDTHVFQKTQAVQDPTAPCPGVR